MSRIPLILLCAGLALSPTSPVVAEANTVKAEAFAVWTPEESPDGSERLRMLLACAGYASQNAVNTEVACEIYDSSGLASAQVYHRRTQQGPVCTCVAHAFVLKPPITWCATATATFGDSTKVTDRFCRNLGSPPPPQDPPPSGGTGDVVKVYTECVEPFALHNRVPDVGTA